MAFPPKKNDAASGSPSASGASSMSQSGSGSGSSSSSESTSNASDSKMKGSKMNPLRKWAASVSQGNAASGSGGDY